MNGYSMVEGILNQFWLVILSNEDYKKQVGVKYISHMWDKTPYWYIWFQQFKGVYKLEVAEISDDVAGYDWIVNFNVKYYPHLEEKWFSGLSYFEQVCRTSEAFESLPCQETTCVLHGCAHSHVKFPDLIDETGVPNYQQGKDIPAEFFSAGSILLVFKDGVGSFLRTKSQSAWRVTMNDDYYVTDARAQKYLILAKGDIDREFAGHEIVRSFCQQFLIGWQLYHNYTCAEESLWEGVGVEFFSDGNSLQAVESTRIKKLVADYGLSYSNKYLLPPDDEDVASLQNVTLGKEVG